MGGWSRRAASLLLLGLLAGSPARAEVVDRVAAVVDREVITLSEIYDLGGAHIEEQLRRAGTDDPSARRRLELEVLDALIARLLVQQEVERLGIDVTDADLERALADIARQNGIDRSQLQAEVVASGLPWDAYLEELRSSIREIKFNQQVLAPRITVREDEVRDAWRRNAAALSGPPAVRLEAIFLPYPAEGGDEGQAAVRARAEAIRAEVAAGTEFSAVAARESAEPYASTGGQMGTFRQGELVGALDAAAFGTPVGDVSPPVPTPQGLFLLHPVERVQPEPPDFETVKEPIEQQLLEGKLGAAREQWVAQARRKAPIDVLLEAPEDAPALPVGPVAPEPPPAGSPPAAPDASPEEDSSGGAPAP